MSEKQDWTTPAIPAEQKTAIPAGWWERIDAEEAALNEAIREEAHRLAADADPSETERLVALGMTVVRRLLERYRP